MLDAVLQGWESVFGRTIDPDDNVFDDLHAESLQILELLEVMGDILDVYVTVDDLYSHPTPRAVMALAEAGANGAA